MAGRSLFAGEADQYPNAQRSRDDLVASLDRATAGLTDPDEIRAARLRVIGQFQDTPPPLDTAQVAQALAATATAMRQASGITSVPLPDVPVLPAGADLAARVTAYKAALPAPELIGRRQVQRPMFAATTLADLEAGHAPAVQMTTIGVPDRAEDGGPGHIANRHLDIVTAAGRDMDAALQEHMATVGGLTPEREAASTAAKARALEIRSQRMDLSASRDQAAQDAADAHARAHGFAHYEDLLDQMRELKGPYANDDDDAEWERLKVIREGARTARQEAGSAVDQRREQLAVERDQLREAVITDRERADARRNAALAVLAKVRPDGLGGVKLTYQQSTASKNSWPILTERSELVKAMRWAEQHYPTSWLAGAHARGFKTVAGQGGVYRLGVIQRGQYTDGDRKIELSKGTGQVTGGGVYDHVSVHELGHGMERAVPGLTALEDAYLWSRTSSGEVGSRKRAPLERLGSGYGADEAAYRSDFPERYTAKEYGNGNNTAASYEVFTTAVESLFAGSNYLDPSMQQWVLGTLATL